MNKEELMKKRAALFDQANEILNKADEEKRDLTAEERNKYDAIMADFDQIKADLERLDARDAAQKVLEQRDHGSLKPPLKNGPEEKEKRAKEYRELFVRFLRGESVAEEIRAMSIGTPANGGYLVPEEWNNEIVEKLPAVSIVRQHATILRSSGVLNIPVQNARGTVYWKDEAAAYGESTPTFTEAELKGYKLTYLVKLSEELVQDEAFDLMGYLARMYAQLAGEAQETKFCQGAGTTEISGLITGAGAGVTAASQTALTADEIIDLIYSIPSQYRGKSISLMKNATAKAIRKLKNSTTGEYLWQPALAAGQPDTLLGVPVGMTEGMPSIAAGASPILIGDLSFYYILERGVREIQRLNELYAGNGQIGYRVFERVDGVLTTSDAVKKLTMAAAST